MIDARPEHIGGKQIGGELDSAKRTVDTCRHGTGQEGLAHSGNVLDQHVPFGQKRHHGKLDCLGLAQHHKRDVVQKPVRQAQQVVLRRRYGFGRGG